VHDLAFALARRLLSGEVVRLVDEHGRRWEASAHALSWVVAQEAAPVLEGSAGDVAIEVVRRDLKPSQ
jgi:hypothetical protein